MTRRVRASVGMTWRQAYQCWGQPCWRTIGSPCAGLGHVEADLAHVDEEMAHARHVGEVGRERLGEGRNRHGGAA